MPGWLKCFSWLFQPRPDSYPSVFVHQKGCYNVIEYDPKLVSLGSEQQDRDCVCGDSSHNVRDTIDSQGCGSQSASLRFPTEIWQHIVGCTDRRDASEAIEDGRLFVVQGKINALIHLASTSKSLRTIVLEYLVQDINLLRYEDVEFLKGLGRRYTDNLLTHTRRVVCLNSYQVYQAPDNAFEAFRFLQELVLDGHSDVDFGLTRLASSAAADQTQTPPADGTLHDDIYTLDDHLSLRMTYRYLKAKFPPTLKTLRIYNSHVPDIYFIHKVTRECPDLRSLTLARCTMFTQSGCEFWKRLPHGESDSYFSNQGISAYATAVGRELLKIRELCEIQIGIYLTAHEAIALHLREHANSTFTGDEETWAKPCHECAAKYQVETDASEKAAALVLKKVVPNLSRVSWLSFFSPGRVGWSVHHVKTES